MAVARVGTDQAVENDANYTAPSAADALVVKVFASVEGNGGDGTLATGICSIGDGGGGATGRSVSPIIFDTSSDPDGLSGIVVFTRSEFTAGVAVSIGVTLGGEVSATNDVRMIVCARSGVDQTTPTVASSSYAAEVSSGTSRPFGPVPTAVDGSVEVAVARIANATEISATGLTVDQTEVSATAVRSFALSALTDGTDFSSTFNGVNNGSWAVTSVSLNPAAATATAVSAPQITSLSQTLLQTGDTVTIEGSDFGTATGTVSISSENSASGSVLVAQTVTAWTDTSVQFTVARGSHANRVDRFVYVQDAEGVDSSSGATASFIPVVTITDRFRDISGTAQSSITNLSVLVYHGVPDSVTADQVLSAQALDAESSSGWQISAGALDDGDPVYVSVWDSAGAALATAFQTTPTYT